MNIIDKQEFDSLNEEVTEEQVMQEELDKFNQIKQGFIDKKAETSHSESHSELHSENQTESNIEKKVENSDAKSETKSDAKSGDEMIAELTPTELVELEQQVEAAIKTIFDPEIPVNIWELGLIYDISITHSREVVVLMTLTAPNCPEAGGIPIEVENRVKELPDIVNCKAILTFDPPWDMNRMSEVAKFELGML